MKTINNLYSIKLHLLFKDNLRQHVVDEWFYYICRVLGIEIWVTINLLSLLDAYNVLRCKNVVWWSEHLHKIRKASVRNNQLTTIILFIDLRSFTVKILPSGNRITLFTCKKAAKLIVIPKGMQTTLYCSTNLLYLVSFLIYKDKTVLKVHNFVTNNFSVFF